MMQRSNRQTVPQIFIDDFHVGGYDDLASLEMSGRLNQMLGIEEE
jgi:glutaredoxin 3